MTEPQMSDRQDQRPDDEGRGVMVVGPDGRPIGALSVGEQPGEEQPEGEAHEDPAKLVEQPAKVMRVGSMIKQLLEEVRAAPLDEAGRQRLKEIHHQSIVELEDSLAPELRDELRRLSLPFGDEEVPSEAELRIAQAQLVGWLEGLFHGIQAALVAQQMAARLQLDQIRSGRQPALPSAPGGMPVMPGVPSRQTQEQDRPVPGQYL